MNTCIFSRLHSTGIKNNVVQMISVCLKVLHQADRTLTSFDRKYLF